MAEAEHRYAYAFESGVGWRDARPSLRLATSGGSVPHPHFFEGQLARPRLVADLLIALAAVANTRFDWPAAMVKRIIAARDPVVTSGGERLRLEAFSPCRGAYARVDLDPEVFDGEWFGSGTTNVNFNPPMLAALAGLDDGQQAGLRVGADRVELHRTEGAIVERKVPLPERWLKGFVGVQAFRSLAPALECGAEEAAALLESAPRQVTRGVVHHLVRAETGHLRLATRPHPGSIPVGGSGRVRVLAPLVRHARALRIHGSPDGSSAFELVAEGARFHLVLSPESSRGFSGEGKALDVLASGAGREDVAAVRATLKWQAKLDSAAIARELGRPEETIRSALAVLGTRGLVGYDLTARAYFHRELPFDLAQAEALEPRLLAARALAGDDGVRFVAPDEAYVRGSDSVEHRVRLDGDAARCTCRWYARHRGERGPCKHILAARLARGSQP